LLGGDVDAAKFLDVASAADRAILNDLYHGRVVHAERFGANKNTGSLWAVRIEHEGRTREALFKPRTYGDRDGWARTPMEVVAYKLNRILGLDVVPPSAYRRDVVLAGQHFAEGALMFRVDDPHGVGNVPRSEWKPRLEAFASDLRVVQVLLADADHENINNIIRGRHWKDGKYRVMKVDNEACLRQAADVRLEHHSAIWGPVTRFNGHTLQRLKELSFVDLKGDLGEHLGDDEIRRILAARDGLIAHINEQIRQRGWGVLFSEQEINFDARLRVGRPASAKELAKFEASLSRKGVVLTYLPGRRLKGALGQTTLRPDGLRVIIGRRADRAPRLTTLVEELAHVNQLRRMARQVGGLATLYEELRADPERTRAIEASMETNAKDKLKRLASTDRDLRLIALAQRRFERRLPAGSKDPGRLWRGAFRSSTVDSSSASLQQRRSR
jgi:hypothetical protein